MDFIKAKTRSLILFCIFLSLRGSWSKSLKLSGFVEHLCQNECFMSCVLLERICLLLSPLFPAAFMLCIFHHHSPILSPFQKIECLTLHILSCKLSPEFVLSVARQLLAPGYQEIWYTADGARKSSSPANTVSL